jgi:hypothetical protein
MKLFNEISLKDVDIEYLGPKLVAQVALEWTLGANKLHICSVPNEFNN